MADVSYGSLPFAEQIAFFRRKLNLPTNAWTDIWEAEHDHAFVVAGANRDDLVADFRAAVDKAIAQGTTLVQFRKDFDAIVAKHGWSYNGGRNWRSRVIYETNLRTSYAAARYAQLQEAKASRPFWQYVHSDSVQHPRPQHVAWNGLVLHADDPWWRTHFPPNGWGCQCSVRSLALRDLKRMGRDGPDQAPPEDLQTVDVGARGATPRTIQTPAGVDPGFGYAPGRDAFETWLKPQATAAIERAAPDGAWRALTQTTAKDLGRPTRVPLQPAPVPLGPVLKTPEAVVDALRELLGGDSRVFDVHGLPVAISADVLGRHLGKDLGRTPYLPLLLDLLADPWEVWYALERNDATGKTRARARMLKGYDVGKGRVLLLVASEVEGLLEGWTMLQTWDLAYVDRQRQGLLWFGANE